MITRFKTVSGGVYFYNDVTMEIQRIEQLGPHKNHRTVRGVAHQDPVIAIGSPVCISMDHPDPEKENLYLTTTPVVEIELNATIEEAA